MFKKLFVVAVVFAVSAISSVNQSQADERVRGYVRSNGSYVGSYYRSNRDGNFWNNYSTYPNVNPYTGSIGTHHRPSYSSSWNQTQYGSPAINYQFDRSGNVDPYASGIIQPVQRGIFGRW